jgi:hypothetical protein
MKFGMYIRAPEPISTAYFMLPPITLCLYVCVPSTVGRQRLVLNNSSVYTIPRQGMHEKNRRTVAHVIFCAVRVLSDESLCLCSSLSLLGNNSVKTFSSEHLVHVMLLSYLRTFIF